MDKNLIMGYTPHTPKKNIEDFIRDHKDEFNTQFVDERHEDKFLVKLSRRFKKIISIVPYLIRVFIVAIIVFTASIYVWNSYLRKDRHEITLKQKIENIVILKK